MACCTESVTARPAAEATAGTLLGLGLVHLERTTLEVDTVQRLHGAGGIRIRHFHEAEATGTAGLAVIDEGQRLDGAVWREQRAHGVFGRGKGKISNK